MSRASPVRAALVAALMVGLVTALKFGAQETLGRDAPFALFALAIVGSGWWAGHLSALIASALATLSGWVWFMRPLGSFAIHDEMTLIRVIALFLEGVGITWIVSRMDAARIDARDAAERVSRLQTLTAGLAAARTPEQVGEVMVREGVAWLGAASAVFVQPVDGDTLTVVAHHGIDLAVVDEHGRFPQQSALPTAQAYRTGRAEWLEEEGEYLRRYPALMQTAAEVRAAATLPLMLGKEALGAVSFRFQERRQFGRAERELIGTMVSQSTQALDRATSFAREVRTRERLEALGELTEALSSALTRADVAHIVVERGVRAAGADTCTIYAFDDSDRSLRLIGHLGISAAMIERVARITHDSNNPSFHAVASRQTVWAESDEEYLAFYPELASMKPGDRRARAFWMVPLVSEGRVIGLLGMGFLAPRPFPAEERRFVDIFARHCAEALRRAELVQAEREARAGAELVRASLETTLRSIGDAVITTDRTCAVQLMNDVAERLTGWSEQDAQGRPLREVFYIRNEHTRREVANPAERVLRDGVVVGLANDTVLVHRDGSRETPIDDSGAPIRDATGAITGVVLVFRDVSASKRHEARRAFLGDATAVLAESLDYQATLAKVAQLAVPRLADWCSVDLDETGQGDPKRLAVAHIDPAKVDLARDLATRYPNRPQATTGVGAVLRSGRAQLYETISDELLRASIADPEQLRVTRDLGLRSAMLVPLIARGRALGVITLVHAESGRHYQQDDLDFALDLAHRCAVALDNAQLYASERRARHSADLANSAKDEFLAMVSHELRTPLNAIMGWAKMLATRTLDDSTKGRAVTTIERNAVAMARLIEDLLDIARMTSGKMSLEVEAVHLDQVVEAAIEAVRQAAEAKEIELSAALDPQVAPITGDPARLQQVVWNLLSNAVKFTPQGGRVAVALRRVDSAVELTVTDTGSGIKPAFLPFVVEAFRQQHGAARASRGGLGLGLAIARQLIELHGGRIEVRSDGEGQGTTFTVSLPLRATTKTEVGEANEAAHSSTSGTAFERPTQLRGLRVMVVDDDEDCRHLVKAVLEQCGSTVATFDGVDSALRAIDEQLPDVIISDIGMPGRDGYDLIRAVRALPAERGGNLPAAALTANAYAEDRRRVLNAGFTMHIAKPVEPAELVAVVVGLTRYSPRRADR